MVDSKPTDISNILTGKNEKNPLEQTEKKIKNGRISKDIKFREKRKEVLQKLLEIIGTTGNNKVFYMEDISGSEDKKKAILGLVDDVKKYFSCSAWVYFCKSTPDPYVSLSKSILKDMGYVLIKEYQMDRLNQKIAKKGFYLQAPDE